MLQLPSSGLQCSLEKAPFLIIYFIFYSFLQRVRQEFTLPKGTGQVVLKTESQLAQLVPSLDFNPRALNFPSSFSEHFFNSTTEFQSRKSLVFAGMDAVPQALAGERRVRRWPRGRSARADLAVKNVWCS